MTTTTKKNIQQRLAFLYGDEQSHLIYEKLIEYIEHHRSSRNRSVVGPLWTHKDIVLISYGNSIQSPNAPALQSLRSFLTKQLPTEFSMLHILPFFPWSSDFQARRWWSKPNRHDLAAPPFAIVSGIVPRCLIGF